VHARTLAPITEYMLSNDVVYVEKSIEDLRSIHVCGSRSNSNLI